MIALAVVAGVLTVLFLLYRPPAWLIRACKYRWPDVLWCVDTTKRVVALTIDDGPSQHTEDILDVLRQNNATATFFVIGSHFSRRKETLERIVQEGHELSNHAMYDEPSRSLSLDKLELQIRSVEAAIENVYESCGKEPPPRYFRPGSGFFSTAMRDMLQKMGYRLVLGSVYPHDPQIPFWRINAWHVLSLLRPGAIIICHDGRSWTAPMLQRVLPEIRRRGYEVVNATRLLNDDLAK